MNRYLRVLNEKADAVDATLRRHFPSPLSNVGLVLILVSGHLIPDHLAYLRGMLCGIGFGLVFLNPTGIVGYWAWSRGNGRRNASGAPR